jgi:hypothetical protein
MEPRGHLRITDEIRGGVLQGKLLKLSLAAVDRRLQNGRRHNARGISPAKTGMLLKNQIQVRTFADWDDVSLRFLKST